MDRRSQKNPAVGFAPGAYATDWKQLQSSLTCLSPPAAAVGVHVRNRKQADALSTSNLEAASACASSESCNSTAPAVAVLTDDGHPRIIFCRPFKKKISLQYSQLKVGGAAVLCTLVALALTVARSIRLYLYTGHSVDVAIGADSQLWMKLTAIRTLSCLSLNTN